MVYSGSRLAPEDFSTRFVVDKLLETLSDSSGSVSIQILQKEHYGPRNIGTRHTSAGSEANWKFL